MQNHFEYAFTPTISDASRAAYRALKEKFGARARNLAESGDLMLALADLPGPRDATPATPPVVIHRGDLGRRVRFALPEWVGDVAYTFARNGDLVWKLRANSPCESPSGSARATFAIALTQPESSRVVARGASILTYESDYEPRAFRHYLEGRERLRLLSTRDIAPYRAAYLAAFDALVENPTDRDREWMKSLGIGRREAREILAREFDRKAARSGVADSDFGFNWGSLRLALYQALLDVVTDLENEEFAAVEEAEDAALARAGGPHPDARAQIMNPAGEQARAAFWSNPRIPRYLASFHALLPTLDLRHDELYSRGPIRARAQVTHRAPLDGGASTFELKVDKIR